MGPILRNLSLTFFTATFALANLAGRANNITVSAGSLTGNTGSSVQIRFDVSWENSWRINPDRWDAAWIFAKYRTTDGMWRNVWLNGSGHVAPAGSTITVGCSRTFSAFDPITNPGLGAFLYRSADGSGNLTASSVELQWLYQWQQNGLSLSDVQEVRVFAIEMVHVPQGAFAAGSGGTEALAFTLTTINSSSASTAPAGTGTLGGQAGGFPTGQTAPTNADWPTGYGAFYCMKYEVSQQGYVDFLNTLTYTQQTVRTANVPNSVAGTGAMVTGNLNRNGIDIQTPGLASTLPAVYACNLDGDGTYGEPVDGQNIACNYLSWGDLSAYLYWSCLRPMSELEFEKACRGTAAPVPNEYPWGTTSRASNAYTLANNGASNEGIATNYSSTLGNASYSSTATSINGPVRAGILSANSGNTGRVTAGASYYGIMELAGNLLERPVTIGNASGGGFQGHIYPSYNLPANGDQAGLSWPSAITADGAGFRGGSWADGPESMRASDRTFATTPNAIRNYHSGGRGVRSLY